MTSFDEFTDAAKQANVIPVYTTCLADMLTPVSVCQCLQTLSSEVFLFENVEGGEKTARFSFLGCSPFASIRCTRNVLDVRENGRHSQMHGNIFEHLSARFSRYKVARFDGLPRFAGGALGYLDFSGNLDTCIAIRTIVTKGDCAYSQAGAGIVADSVPGREFDETLHKSAALRARRLILPKRGFNDFSYR